MEKHIIQKIDYKDNPYFTKNLQLENKFSRADNIALLKLINSVDAVIEFVTKTKINNPIKKFEEHAGIYLINILDILDKRSKNDLELNESLLSLHHESIRLVKNHINNLTSNDDFVSDLDVSNKDEIISKINSISEHGYVEFSFDHTDKFLGWSQQQLDRARLKYESESDWRGGNAYDRDSEEFKIIEDFIQDNKILKVISEYKKMNMELYYAAWDYSHNRQKWFRNNHEYDHLSPTNYYHFDADVDVAKMLIYLTDVGEGDGAFKFVKGSNTMPRSVYLTYIYYAVDTIISPRYRKIENLYGRGLFLYNKDLLMKFPECFMGSTHFGDDVIDGSDLSHYLLHNTTTFTRKKGSVVLFDGFTGIHAGGNAFTGERLAIQVAFKRKRSIDEERPKTSFSKNPIKFARKILGPIKRRLVGSSIKNF